MGTSNFLKSSPELRAPRTGSRHRFRRVAPLALGLALAVTLLAGSANALAAQQVISSTGPLTNIFLNDNLACNANHSGDTAFEFYGGSDPGACGTFIAVAGTVYGPTVPAGIARTDYTPVSQSGVTGTGTSSNPYTVVTVVDVGTTGLRITQTDSYVVGDEAYRTSITVSNSTTSAVSTALYHAGDCFLQNSDTGFGFVDSSTGGVFCSTNANNTPPARIEGFIPLSTGSNYLEDNFGTVWTAIDGTQFANTCACNSLIDNGAGLSWDITVPAGGSITRSLLTSFSPLGRVPLTTTKTADNGSVQASSADGYTITVSNPNPTAVTLNSITDTLPAGFTYTPGSTTGATSANPSISGQTLTWAGPITVPASSGGGPGTASLHFGVTVASTPGDYLNNAGGDSTDFTIVPTGDTALITVTPGPTGGQLEVTKVLSPAGDPGRFNLQIDGTTQRADAGNGDTTGAQSVTAGPHTVGETAGTGTSLADYTSAIECRGNNGTGSVVASGSNAGPLNVTVNQGDDIVCTITNTRNTVGTPGCEVEGDGHIRAENGDRAQFSLDIDSGTTPRGRLRYKDGGPAQRLKLRSTAITSVTISPDQHEATITGTGTLGGGSSVDFRVVVRDIPGSTPDTFRITLSNGYDSGEQRIHGDVDVDCDEADDDGSHNHH